MHVGEIRKKFFDFFEQRGHAKVASSSLIPADDPTLLFANAGMNQFKDLFLGREKRAYTRAVSIQKCMRAGGKHNDLENVGFTSRHLTFFEMMGNFSFGDYFKLDAITFAWDFLTKTVGLAPERLFASVYEQDDEAYELWHRHVGLPVERIVRLGARDNFWQMGDTGPCGPCSEIYYDRGSEYGCRTAACAPGCDCDRFLEIWNLVFMQFDRQKDGTDKPLAAKGVDTGMGLERLCAVLQGKASVFETDIFAPIIAQIDEILGRSYATSDQSTQAAYRVIADHIRSSTLAIADGGMPAADGRGYVIRKIIRRAALFAHKLSPQPFFPQLVASVIASLGDVYPEVKAQQAMIQKVLAYEVEQFSRNLVRGKALLDTYFTTHDLKMPVSGVMAFTLYDTYGFPLELTKVIAQEQGVGVDEIGFATEMERQRLQSSQKEAPVSLPLDSSLVTNFTGYTDLVTTSPILALVHEGKLVDRVSHGAYCFVVPAATPFYVECGGQISDEGWVTCDGQKTALQNVMKYGNAIVLGIRAPQDLHVGMSITQKVDATRRSNTMKNHTATHLLQSALMKVLGSTIKQAGSLVAPDYLRFDFSYHAQPTAEQVEAVERMVNEKIVENIPVATRSTTLQDAQKEGVIAFFGEKYNPENVRVVAIPGFSAELCGGTHVRATGDIGSFKITEIGSLSAGSRRIVAVTGPRAYDLFQSSTGIVKELCRTFKTTEDKLVELIDKQTLQLKEAKQQLKTARRQLWKVQAPQWVASAEVVKGIPYKIMMLEQISAEELRELVQLLSTERAGLWVVVGTDSQHEKITFAATVAPSFHERLSGKRLHAALMELGLKGGLSDGLIQGGAAALPARLSEVLRGLLEA